VSGYVLRNHPKENLSLSYKKKKIIIIILKVEILKIDLHDTHEAHFQLQEKLFELSVV
jgi:hypothetical protein